MAHSATILLGVARAALQAWRRNRTLQASVANITRARARRRNTLGDVRVGDERHRTAHRTHHHLRQNERIVAPYKRRLNSMTSKQRRKIRRATRWQNIWWQRAGREEDRRRAMRGRQTASRKKQSSVIAKKKAALPHHKNNQARLE